MALIENTGTFGLETDANDQYFIVELDGGNPQAPLVGGISVGITSAGLPVLSADTTLLNVEANAITGGYTIVLESVTPGEYYTWEVDVNGVFQSEDLTPDIAALELEWGQDINGDGVVPVDAEGAVYAQTAGGAYQIVPGAGTGTPIALTEGGNAVTDTTYPDWQVVEVESDGGTGYTVVWAGVTAATDGQYLTWTVDATGAKVGGAALVSDVFALEDTLGVDIDGDGEVGAVVTPPTIAPVDEEGAVYAQTADGAYQIVPGAGTGTPIALTEGGNAVTDTTYPDWQVVEVESDGGTGYTVVWAGVTAATDGQYLTWTVDATGAKVGGAALVSDVFALEDTLGVDIDGDGEVGAVVTPPTIAPVDEEGAVYAQTADGAYQIVPGAGTGTPIALTEGGNAVTDTTYPDWQVVEVESDGGTGYTVVWAGVTAATDGQYLTWTVDATGAKVGGAVFVSDVFALEDTLGVDIDGDGEVGAVVTPPTIAPVDEEGAVYAQTADGAYQIVPGAGTGTPIALTEGGNAVTDTTYPDWQVVEVESDGGTGYTVVWAGVTAATDGQYLTWTVDATGAKVGGAALVSDVFALEDTLGVDIDGDGEVGAVVTPPTIAPVDEEGAVYAQTADGAYQIVPGAGTGTPIALTEGGNAVTDTTYPDWQVVEVESDGGTGYTVVWAGVTAATDGQYLTWTVDATGAKVGGAALVSDVFALEDTLGVDIDGDGEVGAVVTPPTIAPVDEEGAVYAQTADGAYQIVPGAGTGTPIALTDGGNAVTDTTYPDWQVVEVESDGGTGYTVVWAGVTAATDGQYLTWTVDATGAKVGGAVFVSDVFALEDTLGVDIDGDGEVGAVVTPPTIAPVDEEGAVYAQTADGAYQIVPGAGTGTPIALTDGGNAVTDTTYPDWQVVEVESDGGTGYTVVWAGVTAATDGQYLTWTVDATGAKVGGAVFVSDVIALEDTLGVDIDGDGEVGAVVTPPTIAPVDEEGAVYAQTADGAYQIVPGAGTGTPIALTEGGNAVTDTTYPDWQVVEVESDGGTGYTVVWAGVTAATDGQYLTWTVDATGAKVGGAVFVSDVIALEDTLGVDIDGDGEVGAQPSVFGLQQDDVTDQYFIVELDDADPPAPLVGGISLGLTDENGAVAGPIAGYLPIAVIAEGSSGYSVLWENPTDPENPLYVVWNVDEAGAKVGPALAVEDPIANGFEVAFGIDLNEDGFLTVENNGGTELGVEIATGQFYVSDGTPEGTVALQDDEFGDPATADEVDPSVIGIQAEQAADGSYIFLIETDAGYEFTTATATGVIAPGDPTPIAETDAELLFQLDLDGDGFIFLEDNGAISAKTDATTGQFIAVDGGGIETGFTFEAVGEVPPELVTQENTPSNILQIELDPADDFIVLLETDGTYETQTVGSDGVVDAASEASIAAITLSDAETLFNVDLDGDGFVGVA